MRIRSSLLSFSLFAVLSSAPVFAQQHVADATAMQQAVAARSKTDQHNREAVIKALGRTDVQQLAGTMGLDLKQATAAVGTMSSDELSQLAETARAIETNNAAGATTVVISLTTILLIIIIIILIAN